MGAGYHGGFGNTYGAVAGDAVYKSKPLTYFEYISKRPVKDAGGVYDIVAHGESNAIQFEHNGEIMALDARTVARMLKNKKDYSKKQPIRLLSCSTGSDSLGFAQNLANKLGVVVEAPTKLVWACPNGDYFVAGRSTSNPNRPDYKNRGKFIKFYPGGNKK